MTHAVDDRLRSMYESYYGDSKLDQKRRITAEMTIDHVTALTGGASLGKVVDVGAGQGSFVELLSNFGPNTPNNGARNFGDRDRRDLRAKSQGR